MKDEDIERARAQGQSNKANFRLVKNWCEHIRIERAGGVGMIEEATGEPIGHFSPACDHAGADGIMCWDIRPAAVEFYDRHCSKCSLRKPVGKPDLSQWVAERDAQVAAAEAEQAAAAAEAAVALEARRDARLDLRQGLEPAAANVVDQLAELDGHGTADLVRRLVETARLAPEAFPEPIRGHLFMLLEEDELWAHDAALEVLAALGVDPQRLARAAANSLRRGIASLSPVRAFLRSLDHADPADVGDVYTALVELAEPHRQAFERRRKPRRAPLVLLARAFPAEVKRKIDDLLSKGDPDSVSSAARGISALIRRAPDTVAGFARTLVSTLARAKWIPDEDSLSRGVAKAAGLDLAETVVDLFRRDPLTVDGLLQQYRAGASDEGDRRIFRVYRAVLRDRSFRKERVVGPAERVAFTRLFREAPKTTNWAILEEIGHGIDKRPDGLVTLAVEFRDELLGSAIQMDERLIAFDAESKPTNLFDNLERRRRRDALSTLRGKFVAWAAAGAAATENYGAYTQVLANLPEIRDGFAACMIENAVALVTTVQGLNAILPALYGGLVGASVLRRGAAVTAVGKLPSHLRRHAPELLFEAFVPALRDPFVYVHKSALDALRGMKLPEAFDGRVLRAVWGLVNLYSRDGDDDHLVTEGIELLVGGLLSEKECAGRPGAHLVSVLAKMRLWSLPSHMRFLARKLGRAAGFVDLLIRMLTDPEATEHTLDDVVDALAALPNEVLYEHRAALSAVPPGPVWETRRVVHALVELLTRAGAWAEAAQIADQAAAAIPATRRELPQRRFMELAAAAARYELAVASGDRDGAAAAVALWRSLKTEARRDVDAA